MTVRMLRVCITRKSNAIKLKQIYAYCDMCFHKIEMANYIARLMFDLLVFWILFLLPYFQNAARQRRLKYLRVQLEQQNQAYEEMKQKVEMLQHSQAECKSHVSGESSGYADFSDVSSTQIGGADGGDMPDEQQQGQQEQKQQQLSIARSHSSAEESQNNSLQFTNRMLGEEADDKKKNKEEGKKATLYMVSSWHRTFVVV